MKEKAASDSEPSDGLLSFYKAEEVIMEGHLGYAGDRIRIGEMAELFHISSRTLRLYHDMGLLVPWEIDEETGYRYYSSKQFERLEKILQMRSLGISLKQIKSMLDGNNLSVFEALLSERIDQLNERISEDTSSLNALIKQLNSCAYLRNPPVVDSPFIEFIPKRTAIEFPVEAYDLRQYYGLDSPWKNLTLKLQPELEKNDLPSTLMEQSCCVISQEDLLEGNYNICKCWILTDKFYPVNLTQTTIPAATYACLYRNYIALDSKSEGLGLDILLDYIRKNNYKIKGSYLGEVIARMSFFDYSNKNILVKLQIPVKVNE